MRLGTLLSAYAAVAATAALALAGYGHLRSSLSLEKLSAREVTAGLLTIEVGGKELIRLTDSSVTGGGAVAIMNATGEQSLLASDGIVAIRGGSRAREALPKLQGWGLILAATSDSSTIAMKGPDDYEVVIEAGKTNDDPIGIRGGRINVTRGAGAAKFDSSGVVVGPPRR